MDCNQALWNKAWWGRWNLQERCQDLPKRHSLLYTFSNSLGSLHASHWDPLRTLIPGLDATATRTPRSHALPTLGDKTTSNLKVRHRHRLSAYSTGNITDARNRHGNKAWWDRPTASADCVGPWAKVRCDQLWIREGNQETSRKLFNDKDLEGGTN